MNRRHPSPSSEPVQHSVAVDLVDRDHEELDTSTTAWAEFDRQMSEQFAALEQQLQRYFTPQATRKELGR